jgi:hypothetical protein
MAAKVWASILLNSAMFFGVDSVHIVSFVISPGIEMEDGRILA